MYHRTICTEGLLFGEEEHGNDRFWGIALVNAYGLGETFQCCDFKNLIIDKFFDYCGSESVLPSFPELGMIYDKTPDNSPLRRLIVDLYIDGNEVYFGKDGDNSDLETLPKEFLLDLCNRFNASQNLADMKWPDFGNVEYSCAPGGNQSFCKDYHEHPKVAETPSPPAQGQGKKQATKSTRGAKGGSK